PAGQAGSSAWAQGGIAAAVGDGDSWLDHCADTLAAGAGICDPKIAGLVTRAAPQRIADLVDLGVPFDRRPDGSLCVGREAAHSAHRIVHVAGDRAGAEVTRTLAHAAQACASIQLLEGFHAVDLAVENGRVVGLFVRTGSARKSRLMLFRAPSVILASGGLGALFAVTTNPPEARGQGLGMAARAGACIADAEFVQFHPTAIAVGRDPAPLATEALRGDGAQLVDEAGRRIMSGVHEALELAPRDVVARAIHREMGHGHSVFLDCRSAIGTRFEERFPTVFAACTAAGVDPATMPIPVAPAAHYHMGGIAVDAWGRSSLDGLWAVGECAATGLHGANRLASNSLLEALVFGARVAEDIRGQHGFGTHTLHPPTPTLGASNPAVPERLRQIMSRYAGLERDDAGLRRALCDIIALEHAGAGDPSFLNMTATAKLVAAAALMRQESRGGHFRSDYPQTQQQGARSFLYLKDAERSAAEADCGAKAKVSAA
ncbi:MAG: L-aspartate oxidase, partial [Alphaproteobacteria bacterium]|nr:L-aspartate oxidase [Alphaproteobacteria bacterium]